MNTTGNIKRRNFLIKLKVKYTTEYFDIFKMKKESIKKIERCDRPNQAVKIKQPVKTSRYLFAEYI